MSGYSSDKRWNQGGSYGGYGGYGGSVGSAGGGSTGFTSVPKCRHGPTPVIQDPETGLVYHASSYGHGPTWKGDLWITLSGESAKDPTFAEGWKAEKFNKLVTTPDNYLDLDWPDYKEPPVPLKFFKMLHQEIVKAKFKNVLISCMGGHGRTGTALAAILVAAFNYEPEDAVDFVHTNYCEEAIESRAQFEYLGAKYETFVKEEERKTWGTTTKSWKK